MVLQCVAISQKPCGPAFIYNILANPWPCGKGSAGMICAEPGFQQISL